MHQRKMINSMIINDNDHGQVMASWKYMAINSNQND